MGIWSIEYLCHLCHNSSNKQQIVVCFHAIRLTLASAGMKSKFILRKCVIFRSGEKWNCRTIFSLLLSLPERGIDLYVTKMLTEETIRNFNFKLFLVPSQPMVVPIHLDVRDCPCVEYEEDSVGKAVWGSCLTVRPIAGVDSDQTEFGSAHCCYQKVGHNAHRSSSNQRELDENGAVLAFGSQMLRCTIPLDIQWCWEKANF